MEQAVRGRRRGQDCKLNDCSWKEAEVGGQEGKRGGNTQYLRVEGSKECKNVRLSWVFICLLLFF